MIAKVSSDPPSPCQWPVRPFNVQQGPSTTFVFRSDQAVTVGSNAQPAQWGLHMRWLFLWGMSSISITATNDHPSPTLWTRLYPSFIPQIILHNNPTSLRATISHQLRWRRILWIRPTPALIRRLAPAHSTSGCIVMSARWCTMVVMMTMAMLMIIVMIVMTRWPCKCSTSKKINPGYFISATLVNSFIITKESPLKMSLFHSKGPPWDVLGYSHGMA